ncbi:DmsC/YnfH family molybdoenzyme membrane anchor subunit [Singulisphaera sp. PoT]|uniref:DmsC/YnfH family molybdoenzyme membrane anchor subunit n=1 Tax=Singulisphaera sp. PoT TaxID=3411797 RepID=UPI003BF4DE5D
MIKDLLEDQRDLSAVERFAQFHEAEQEPIQSRYYSALLPTSNPGPGQQLAFEVDLDRCSGCKACVVACHALNGLDEDECWREVGLIVGGTTALPVLQHVTSSCHHCLEPACMKACPVDAYEKDPITGIVRHLDDQCFGCQYCTLACPYDAPKFQPAKGIVRKCDMCSDRLREGEAPACVQACPHEAISIRLVDRAEIAAQAEAGEFLTSAPDPAYTRPTTRYISERPMSDAMRAADHHRLAPEHAHWPLVLMLVLTQLSVGGFAVDACLGLAGYEVSYVRVGISLAFGLMGLAASTYHLGRPLLAYRAIIGLRHSWLSREVLTFGLFAGAAKTIAAVSFMFTSWLQSHQPIRLGLSLGCVAAGASGVACSVMLYHVVRRPYWRASFGAVKFAVTTLVLGLAVTLLASTLEAKNASIGRELAWGISLAVAIKVAFEGSLLRHLKDEELTPLKRSAMLTVGPLGKVWRFRLLMATFGGFLLPLGLFAAWPLLPGAVSPILAGGVLTLLLLGEIAERYLFFAAVVRHKMPGGLMP